MICTRKHIIYLCEYAKKNNFSFPKCFEGRTYSWLQRHYNGIGAEWMSPKLRNIVTKLLRHMEAEALIHDIEYLLESKSYWRFTVANFRLFYNGVKARHFFSGLMLAIICQLFGWSAWVEGKEMLSYYYYLKRG